MIARAGVAMTPVELVSRIQERLPIFESLTKLQIREFLVHSQLHQLNPSDVVFNQGEYSSSVYMIVDGEVAPEGRPPLGHGKFFGEMALISGERRSSTVTATAPALLLEIERNTILRLVRSEPSIKRAIDEARVAREIETLLGTHVDRATLLGVLASAKLV